MVGKRTFQSAGQLSQHLIPGAFSRVDSVKGAGGLVSANNGVIMGKCTGGEPQTLLQFNSVADAVNTLKSGALLEAVRQAFNPGSGLVPQKLFALRVNTALQSSYTMLATATGIIKLESVDYGLDMNQIIATMANGTNYGKKITLVYKTESEEFDDIRQQSMTIQFTTGSSTVTIVNNSGTNTLVTTGSNPLSIDLNTYPTIGALAAYINNEAGYTVSVISGQEDESSLELDSISSVDIYTAPVTIESTTMKIISVLNAGSGLVEASAVNGANNLEVPDNFSATYLTGGSEGDYTATEWASALAILEAEDIQYISTPDSSASVHSVIKTHCASMCSVTGRKERQALVGGEWGEDIATAVAASGVLNSKYVLRAYNGYTQYDVNGTVQNYSSSYIACLLLGMKVAGAINMPLTFNEFNVISLEKKLKDSELETLIENAVCPASYNNNGNPHCVRQVNSYQSDDLKYNEFSMVSEMNFVSRDIRNYLETTFVGNAGANFFGGAMRGAVEAKLAQYADLGIFTKDSDGVSWWNVQITISGDTVTVDYDAYLTAPINFIFITQHFHELVATA